MWPRDKKQSDEIDTMMDKWSQVWLLHLSLFKYAWMHTGAYRWTEKYFSNFNFLSAYLSVKIKTFWIIQTVCVCVCVCVCAREILSRLITGAVQCSSRFMVGTPRSRRPCGTYTATWRRFYQTIPETGLTAYHQFLIAILLELQLYSDCHSLFTGLIRGSEKLASVLLGILLPV